MLIVPDLLSAGTVPDSRDRSDADRLRRGAWSPPRASSAAHERPRRRPDLQRARRTSPLVADGVLAHDGFRLLVVDDGSPDGTGAIADELAAAASRPRRGHAPDRAARPRPSYIDGLRARARRPTPTLICQMDADLSHDPEYLPALRRGRGAVRLVIGSRYLNGVSVVNWPLHRIFLSAFANRYIRAVTRLSPTRLHQRLPLLAPRGAGAAAARPRCASDGYAFLVEMLYEASAARLPDRRSADHLRRAAAGTVEGLGERADRIADHAVAAACFAAAPAPMTMPPRRRDGDDVVSALSRATASARSWSRSPRSSPRAATRCTSSRRGIRAITRGAGRGRRPLSLLQVRAAPVAERVRLRRGACAPTSRCGRRVCRRAAGARRRLVHGAGASPRRTARR